MTVTGDKPQNADGSLSALHAQEFRVKITFMSLALPCRQPKHVQGDDDDAQQENIAKERMLTNGSVSDQLLLISLAL